MFIVYDVNEHPLLVFGMYHESSKWMGKPLYGVAYGQSMKNTRCFETALRENVGCTGIFLS